MRAEIETVFSSDVVNVAGIVNEGSLLSTIVLRIQTPNGIGKGE